MINVQDLDGLGSHRIDDNVRKRCQRQFSCLYAVTKPSAVRRYFQRADALVDCSHGRFGEMRVVLLQIVLDALQIVGRPGRSNECASGPEHSLKPRIHFLFFDKLPTLGRR